MDCQFQSQGIGRQEKERVVFLPYLLKVLHREAWELPEKLAERVGPVDPRDCAGQVVVESFRIIDVS